VAAQDGRQGSALGKSATAPKFDPLADDVAFPCLSEGELAEARVFGECCAFRAGEPLVSAGQFPFHSYVILSGSVRVVDTSTDEPTIFVRYGAGYFTGDIDLFTGRPSLVTCEAETPVEALRLTADRLRQMFMQRVALGERFWRSFQCRRALLLKSEFRGVNVFGSKYDRDTLDAVELLYRNNVPHYWIDTSIETNARKLGLLKGDVQRYPVIALGQQFLCEAPTRRELAEFVGLRRKLPKTTHDVLILGAGPSGLGAAVYAASEGLSTLVMDSMGPGGQAGSSSRIENYAGYPNGIGGRELAHLTYLQALKFGADFVAPSTVSGIAPTTDGYYRVRSSEGDCATARTVIIATGLSYGRLEANGLDALRGPGIHHNATRVEALLCKGSRVHVVGSGNSAGQAAMFLSQEATAVSLLVRGDKVKMSQYLAQRLLSNEKVRIHFHTEVASIEGTRALEAVWFRDGDGALTREESAGLFVFVGGKPLTDFLPARVAKDERGFVLTGSAVASHPLWGESRLPFTLETTLPGVFASGDCRSGTTKRVAFAIGDGALAITCVHDFLRDSR
jgi:thioredoxin reductase (NADPH)